MASRPGSRRSIPPLTRHGEGDAFRYRAYSRVSSLEMERHRLEMERRGLETRLAALLRRRDELDAEKATLLQALARREAAEAAPEAAPEAVQGEERSTDRPTPDPLALEY